MSDAAVISYKLLASLFLIFFKSVESNFSVTFLHTNDIHSRIEEIDRYGSMCKVADRQARNCFGGFARLATKVKDIRSKAQNVLLVDGGDQETGTLWYDVYDGNATAFFINKLRYDVMVSEETQTQRVRSENHFPQRAWKGMFDLNEIFDFHPIFQHITEKLASSKLSQPKWWADSVFRSKCNIKKGQGYFKGHNVYTMGRDTGYETLQSIWRDKDGIIQGAGG